ncbi:MAG: hypothetical protein QOH04_992 [Sphingomonadales bacterium]|jgi:hypothetical protein|nr:hypothetical protein [Sphingomonadales bacterium]
MSAVATDIGAYHQSGGKAPKLKDVYVYALTPQLPEKQQLGVYFIQAKKGFTPDEKYIAALPKTLSQMEPLSRSMSEVPWECPSYQIYIMYKTNYRFVKNKAIHFTYDEPPFGNHTFWDGNDFRDEYGDVIAFVCRNLRLNHLNDDLGKNGPESEKFFVDFTTIPPIPQPPEQRLHDESGTNTGP